MSSSRGLGIDLLLPHDTLTRRGEKADYLLTYLPGKVTKRGHQSYFLRTCKAANYE